MVERHHLAEWDSYPLDKLLACASAQPMGLGKDPELVKLRDAMRALVPSDLPIQKDGCVVIRPGDKARHHSHYRTWAAAYCVAPGVPPVALIIDSQRIEPERGYVTVIPPGTWHSIETNSGDHDRVSFVILVGDDPRRVTIEQ